MPTIEEGKVIDAPMDDLVKSRNDELDTGINDYPSCCDYDKKIRALMNIFVGTFSVVTEFAVLEDMDAYRDEGMGDVIFGGPFLKEIRIKARRFDG
ncbi:hypothetical protein Tco_0182246, partial [Tanacetum coccineum]